MALVLRIGTRDRPLWPKCPMVQMLDKDYHAAVTPSFGAPRKASFTTSLMFKPSATGRRPWLMGRLPFIMSVPQDPPGHQLQSDRCVRWLAQTRNQPRHAASPSGPTEGRGDS